MKATVSPKFRPDVFIEFSVCFLVVLSAPGAYSQDYWDSGFGNPGLSQGGAIQSIARADNSIVVGGNFSQIGGVKATNVARWDGESWSALGYGLGACDGSTSSQASVVNVIRLIGDQIYAAGAFTNSGNVGLKNAAKWSGSSWVGIGNLDLQGSPVQVTVFDLTGQNENDIYVGGNFSVVDGVPASGIAHWDGEHWLSVGGGVIHSSDTAFVHALALKDGELFIGGSFTAAGRIKATNVAKWTGSDWETLGDGLGPPGQYVYALAVGQDGIYAGGSFTSSAAVPMVGIARWDGLRWNQVGGPTTGNYVVSLSALQDGIVAGGDFRGIAATIATNIAQWTGHEWLALGWGLYPNVVRALMATGTEIFAGGDFRFADQVPAVGIAEWHIPRTLGFQISSLAIRLSWPAADSNLFLQCTGSLRSENWAFLPQVPSVVQGRLTVTNSLTSSNQFYRLKEKNPL